MPDLSPSDELIEIASGPMGRVTVTAACHKVLDKASAKQRARFQALADRAVEYGFNELHSEQFAKEDRLGDGTGKGNTVLIHAFKPWQLRIYGAIIELGGVWTFLGTVIAEKKNNKANRNDLERAAKAMAPFIMMEDRR